MTAICYSRGLGPELMPRWFAAEVTGLLDNIPRSLGNYKANFIKLRLGKKNSNGQKNATKFCLKRRKILLRNKEAHIICTVK